MISLPAAFVRAQRDRGIQPRSRVRSASHHAGGLDRLDQRGPVDAGALLVQQLLPEGDGPGVAAVQEVIGGEQHQGAHLALVLLERATQQALRLGGELLARLVVEHGGLGGLGRRAGPPSCRARRW